MKRLAVVPALFVVGCAYGYWSGLLYPVMTQAWSVIAPRETAYDEDDVMG